MKNTITRLFVALGLLAAAGGAMAASAAIPIEHWPDERGRSLGSLQNGARLFANYCMGCHSANLVRWNRLEQIGLDEKQIKEFLIFGNQKVGDPMRIAMAPAEAKLWFGKTPPDLSVITRARVRCRGRSRALWRWLSPCCCRELPGPSLRAHRSGASPSRFPGSWRRTGATST